MSLPNLTTQAPLFATLTPEFFAPEDRYRLFARQIFPLLVQARPALQQAYCDDNGRPGLEPVVLAGVTVLQFLFGYEALLEGQRSGRPGQLTQSQQT